jgi:hypothetical protein
MPDHRIGSSPHALFICENYHQCGKLDTWDKQFGSEFPADTLYCGTLYLDHVDFNITDSQGNCQFGCLVGEQEFGDFTQHLIPYEEEKDNV